MAKNNNEENISNNQVMAMFEGLNENISFIAGEVSELKENFSNFKQETENNFKAFLIGRVVFQIILMRNWKMLEGN